MTENGAAAIPGEMDWFRDYFREPYGEVYTRYLLGEEQAEAEAQFVCEALELGPGDRLLDSPCGYGRHLAELLPLFPDAVGLDLEPDCLGRARLLLGRRARLLRGDMRRLPFAGEHFDGAFCLFNSFGYFDEAGNRRVLEEYRRVLRPGGGLLLDLANRRPLVELVEEEPMTRYATEGLKLVEHWVYDRQAGCLHNRTEIDYDGGRVERGYAVRLFDRAGIARLLDEVGLHRCSFYGDFEGSDYDERLSERMIVTAWRDS